MWPFKKKGKQKVEITVVENTVLLLDGHLWYHHLHRHHQKVELVFTTFINNFKIRIMSLQLSSAQKSLGILDLIDKDTQNLVAATFDNIQFSGDNDAAFTVAPDPTNPNQCLVTGVAAGTGNVTGKTTVTYTDSVSNQPVTKDLTVVVDVTVTAVTAGENVELRLTFGAPTAQ